MAEYARIGVESAQVANALCAYLVNRDLKARVDRPVVGHVAVLVDKPLLRSGNSFVQNLTLMVEWLSAGHTERVTLDWKGETRVLGTAG
jgi:hypothetical protein